MISLSTFINLHHNEIEVYSSERKSNNAFLKLSSLLEIYNSEQTVEEIQITEANQIDDSFHVSGKGELFSVQSEWKPVQDGSHFIEVDIKVSYNKEVSGDFGLQFKAELVGNGKPTWMIPGAFYKENRFEHNARQYPRYDYRDGNHEEMVSDRWSFRSDRASLPAVFVWNDEMCEISLCGGNVCTWVDRLRF